jgi:hypothetical protein
MISPLLARKAHGGDTKQFRFGGAKESAYWKGDVHRVGDKAHEWTVSYEEALY